jgi:hypothetical protein
VIVQQERASAAQADTANTSADAVLAMQCTCLPLSGRRGMSLAECRSWCAVVASLGVNHSVTSSNSELGITDTD